MDEVAAEQSYRLILCNTRGSANQELHFLQLLRTKQVDGLILASLVNDWETIAPYTDYGPIVICNEYPRQSDGVPVVTIDQSKAMYEATVHLLKKVISKLLIAIRSQKRNPMPLFRHLPKIVI